MYKRQAQQQTQQAYNDAIAQQQTQQAYNDAIAQQQTADAIQAQNLQETIVQQTLEQAMAVPTATPPVPTPTTPSFTGINEEELKNLAIDINNNVKSFGFALTSCTTPEKGSPTFQIADDEMELGVGLHGEPGIERTKLKEANEIVKISVNLNPELPSSNHFSNFVSAFVLDSYFVFFLIVIGKRIILGVINFRLI